MAEEPCILDGKYFSVASRRDGKIVARLERASMKRIGLKGDNKMDELNFTEDEVREGLAQLGYYNVPTERIKEFRNDLENLIREDRSIATSTSDVSNSYSASNNVWQSARERENTAFHLDGQSFRRPVSGGVSSSSSGLANYDHSAGDPRYGYDSSSIDETHSAYPNMKEPYRPKTTYVHPSDEPAKSVALKSCLKKTTFDLDIENYPKERDLHSAGGMLRNDSDESTSVLGINTSQGSSTSTEQRVIRRKVLRKRNGHVEICSESITENDSDDLSCLGEHMNNLQLNVLNNRPLSAPPKVDSEYAHHHQSHFACREPLSYNLPDGYQGPKALIRPMSCEPHMKNIKKSDPVRRYQKYRQSWNMCRAPGERSHNQLRWDIREQMLHHDQVVTKKPQAVHHPNPYVVPGDKKRKTLRWQIRRDLAQGIKPPSIFD